MEKSMRIQILALLCVASFLAPHDVFGKQQVLLKDGKAIVVTQGSSATAAPTTDAKPEEDKKEDENKRKPGEIVVTTVVEGLNNPFSVSIDGDLDRIFVAESGAQRIVEIKDGKAVEVAGEFDAQPYRGYNAGPISLFCPGENVLLVGHDSKEGVGSLTMLKMKPNSEDATKTDIKRETVQIEAKEGDAKLNQFSNILVKHAVIYVVTRGDEENGWIALAEFQKEKITSLRPSIATAKLSNFPGPTCTAVSPAGEYLVISQMGKEGAAKDSRLVFYTLQGKMLRNFEVELQDIVSIAYSPGRKHLFAIDSNSVDPAKGGLYKLIGKGAKKCDVKKLQDLSYATSMAFDSKGNLYITSLGGPPTTDGKPNGKLIKIEGLDDRPDEPNEGDEANKETPAKEEAKQ